MWNEHCTSICRYIFCTCLLRVNWFLSRSYNEAFRASCLATFFTLSSDLGCAWNVLMFAMATRALSSESYWHADIMTSVSIPPCLSGCMSATPNGRQRKRSRNGRRRNGRKRRKEEEEVERRRDGIRRGRGRGGWVWNDKYRSVSAAAAWSRGL